MSLEWLDDDMWATTALGSPSPDFASFPTAAAPCSRAEDLKHAAASGASAIAERPLTCKNANKPQGSCIGIATGILGSMRGNSPLCLMGAHELSTPSSSSMPSAATSTSPSVDSVLSAAREASRLVRGLLDCPTCRSGPQLQLLLTVAFAEVIAGYRRVINTYHHRGGVEELKQQHGADDDLKRAPLSIGSHRIEGAMESVLVGRVVGSRLQELETVMEEVLQPVSVAQPEGGGTKTGAAASSVAVSTLLRGLYLGSDSFLAEQLIAARKELTRLLHHDTGGHSAGP